MTGFFRFLEKKLLGHFDRLPRDLSRWERSAAGSVPPGAANEDVCVCYSGGCDSTLAAAGNIA